MAEYPAFPLWTDAYLADTGHLTTIEHGAYLLLLMTMWRAGGRLPNDPKKLARFARLTPTQWARISPTMMEFFTVEGDEIMQGRLTDELAFVKRRSATQSDNARAKSRKNKEAARAMAQPKRSQTSAPTPTPISKDSSPSDYSEPTAFDELRKVLDEGHSQAVIAHRKGMKGKFTPYAAKLLADKFAKCPDPNAAADAMISNNWQGFEPSWMDRVNRSRGSPQSNRPPTMLELNSQLLAEMENADARRQTDNGQLEPPAGNLPTLWER